MTLTQEAVGMRTVARILIVASVVVSICSSALAGQSRSAVQLSGVWRPMLGGQLAFPIGDFANGAGVGFGLIAGSEFVFNGDIGLRPEVDLTYYSGKSGGSGFASFGFGASVMWHLAAGEGFKPYALLRFGLNTKSGTGSGESGQATTDGSFAPGLGGELRCGSGACFVEAKWYIVRSDPSAQSLLIVFGRHF